ncbi:hypothetical protein WJX81_004846 [Elliptochloris bilobata]|uniref:Uncharacterized protein n=1 Tax=Elliptochloris bilobata TaxID=381761 RepID=A0AAW1QVR7_9CHLO
MFENARSTVYLTPMVFPPPAVCAGPSDQVSLWGMAPASPGPLESGLVGLSYVQDAPYVASRCASPLKAGLAVAGGGLAHVDLTVLEGPTAHPTATVEHWLRVYQWCMTGEFC